MVELQNHYAVLGVTSNAPSEIIRAAYRVMARLHHPDVNKHPSNDPSMMTSINQAYEVLSCPQRRREYDLSLNKLKNYASITREDAYRNVHSNIEYSKPVLTTYDHRGRLHSYV